MSKTNIAGKISSHRKITGMSAILLPFHENGDIDWNGFGNHIQRTANAGLVPAINMDTGYGPLLDDSSSTKALKLASDIMSGQSFVAGVFVDDRPNDAFNEDGYARPIERIQRLGAIPIIFQSFGLAHQTDDDVTNHYQTISRHCDRFLAFELGRMFADFGAIYSLDVYRSLLEIEKCIGAKHSSLSRRAEWDRLALRDEVRPDFMVLTGNDLAIDMVMYGSDYLLGLSTFCPDLFSRRDRFWESGDPAFFELNDVLQYLGAFAFRNPTPAYKHSAAMFLYQRGWIETALTHPACETRPDSDHGILYEIGLSLGIEMRTDRKQPG